MGASDLSLILEGPPDTGSHIHVFGGVAACFLLLRNTLLHQPGGPWAVASLGSAVDPALSCQLVLCATPLVLRIFHIKEGSVASPYSPDICGNSATADLTSPLLAWVFLHGLPRNVGNVSMKRQKDKLPFEDPGCHSHLDLRPWRAVSGEPGLTASKSRSRFLDFYIPFAKVPDVASTLILIANTEDPR
ncbi:hypothetical protein WG66_014179 [Moniliophthora roreri]|nr:hypothetical protein WG66_014179 [Moniliophthora roreri]